MDDLRKRVIQEQAEKRDRIQRHVERQENDPDAKRELHVGGNFLGGTVINVVGNTPIVDFENAIDWD